MKIAAVEAIPYSIPYSTSVAFAIGEVTDASNVLLRIRTDEGVVGHADVLPRPYVYGETTGSVLAALSELFGPLLVGEDALDRNRIDVLLRNTVANNTTKAAIDLALWDILGKVTGISCHRLLGGYTDHVVVSHMVGFDRPEAMAAEAVRIAETYGVTTFKIKVGRRDFAEDVDAVRRIRAALGPRVSIGLDANHGWTADIARRAMGEIGYDAVTLIEEPCAAEEIFGRRRFVRDSPIAVYADESVPTLDMVTREVLAGACNGVNIKTARTGFTQSGRILAACQAMGVEVLVGNQVDTQLGTLASVAFAAAHEATSQRPSEVSNFVLMSDSLLVESVQVRDGRIPVSGAPGLGVEIDEDKLAAYRTDR